MNDLISRQAAIAVADSSDYVGLSVEDVKKVTDEVVKGLKQLPSAQPERKKGEWIVHPEVKNVYGGTYIECSQCGEKYVVQHMEDEKYCRNCGAKMREDGEEE